MLVYFKETISKISNSHFYVELAVIADEKINRKIIPLLCNSVAGRFGDLTYFALLPNNPALHIIVYSWQLPGFKHPVTSESILLTDLVKCGVTSP
jgi:hypothetical protein